MGQISALNCKILNYKNEDCLQAQLKKVTGLTPSDFKQYDFPPLPLIPAVQLRNNQISSVNQPDPFHFNLPGPASRNLILIIILFFLLLHYEIIRDLSQNQITEYHDHGIFYNCIKTNCRP